MHARMANPAVVVPDAMQTMLSLSKIIQSSGIPDRTLELVHLRASQINGCSVCVVGHLRLAKRAGETEERLGSVAAWRDAPYYDDAERAALALTEAVTRLSNPADPVPDRVWDEAARHFDELQLGALLLAIGLVNVWNRINIATRQVAGEPWD